MQAQARVQRRSGGCLPRVQHHAPLAVLLQEALELALRGQPAGTEVHSQLVQQAWREADGHREGRGRPSSGLLAANVLEPTAWTNKFSCADMFDSAGVCSTQHTGSRPSLQARPHHFQQGKLTTCPCLRTGLRRGLTLAARLLTQPVNDGGTSLL